MARTKLSRITEGHKGHMLAIIAGLVNDHANGPQNTFERAYYDADRSVKILSRGKKFRLTLTEVRR